jgi:hypothetical protein
VRPFQSKAGVVSEELRVVKTHGSIGASFDVGLTGGGTFLLHARETKVSERRRRG